MLADILDRILDEWTPSTEVAHLLREASAQSRLEDASAYQRACAESDAEDAAVLAMFD